MRRWDEFLGHFGTVLLFIALQLFCLYLIVQFNERQRNIFNHTSLLFSSAIENKYQSWAQYFQLKEEIDEIHQRNAELKTRLRQVRREGSTDAMLEDSLSAKPCFVYHSADIIRNQVSSRYNHLIINAGRNQGLKEGMAILCDRGIIGQTDYCTGQYCSVLPIINVQSAVSAMISGSDYFGQLTWDGRHVQRAQLEGVPKHAQFTVGDTLVSSGYSTVFPPGELIGTIRDFDVPQGSNFYYIVVDLFVDFPSLRQVYWVENKNQDEVLSIMQESDYGQD
jgi:rod shape-determining protein MreC